MFLILFNYFILLENFGQDFLKFFLFFIFGRAVSSCVWTKSNTQMLSLMFCYFTTK